MHRSESMSMIVLAYNDAPSLPELVEKLERNLAALATSHEIIVVDDGSSDGTENVISEMQHGNPSLRYLRHPRNQGVGAGFRTGVLAAKHAIVGYIDGDGQYDPGDLGLLLSALEDADAVTGERAKREDGFKRNVISGIYNAILRQVYGLPFRDTNSGFKLYRRAFLEAALPLISNGAFYDAEVLMKGLAKGFRCREIPISHYPRRHGIARGVSAVSVGGAIRGIVMDEFAVYRRDTALARSIVGLIKMMFG